MNKIIKELFIFSIPIIMGQIGQMLISAGDVYMAGKHSTEVVAATGVANSIVGMLLMFGMGLMMGIGPIIAKKRGENEQVHSTVYGSILLSIVLSAIISFLCWLFIINLDKFGFQKELIPFIKEYLDIVIYSFIGAFVYTGAREYLQAFEKTFVSNGLAIFCIILNLILNYALIFGNWGFPAMGIKGLAIASLSVRTFMAVVLLIYAIYFSRSKFTISIQFLKDVIYLGSPIAITILLEVSAFTAVGLLIGRMSTIQSAAHNIILTMASTTFMIPLAISSAVSIKVGHALGQKDNARIILFAKSSLIISLGFMLISAACFTLFPEFISSQFTSDPAVIKYCVKLLVVVALFQIADGIQVTIAGILRGLGISKPVFLASIVGYWIYGAPLAYYFAYSKNLQGLGLWIGLACSLCSMAAILSVILKIKIKSLKNNTL
ncbi:MAG: MATE family multidrug resistance protein [Thermoproteota archaeon]|jgi:MATE family multidrug resistance protein